MKPASSSHSRRFYLSLFLVLLGIEIVIGAFIHDRLIRPYVGDILVVVLLYAFVRIVLPQGIRFLSLYVLLFAFLVEILQYFHLGKLLGLEQNRLAMTILGSTFDVKDLLCYLTGWLCIEIAGRFLHRTAP